MRLPRQHSTWVVTVLLGVFVQAAVSVEPESRDLDIQVQTLLRHDDGEFLWFHPRATRIGGRDQVLLTLQKHLHISDYYSGLHHLWSEDLGKTWEGPIEPPELAWGSEPGEVVVGVCDVTPMWHKKTGKAVAVGVKVRYKDGVQLLEKPQSHAAAYAVFDPATRKWTPWKFLEVPEPDGMFFLITPGCTQWVIREDGSILLPVYIRGPEDAPYRATVLECEFDGDEMTYKGHGDILDLQVERGLVEPSLISFGGEYFLTLRNDQKGYVTRSRDGLRWEPIRPWTFDDGEDLGSYNTQQHWAAAPGGLFLVYTRRGANNDHIMRHRAPLFIARIDPVELHAIRTTEQVVIPERGAQMGNFGVNRISDEEWWVTVSEGMWGKAREMGAEGATFVARIRFP